MNFREESQMSYAICGERFRKRKGARRCGFKDFFDNRLLKGLEELDFVKELSGQ
jgi:hypothetical protein